MKMRSGFTLVELLVVITILAVLAGAAIPFVQAYVEESRLAKAKTDLDEISRALVVYETREGEYPDVDVKLLAGRYLNKSPIDPWGSPYLVNKNAGTVYSKGPDREDNLADKNDPKNSDNIIVSYLPPLAIVSVKWIDRNQNGQFDAENIPDQLQINFSRKLSTPDAADIDTGNVNAWFRLSPTGNMADSTAPALAYVQTTSGGGTYLPEVLTSSKSIIMSLPDTYTPATPVVMGKAWLAVNTAAGATDGLFDTDSNLCISSQKVVILPQ